MADRILMTGLVFHGRHGVFPEERRLGARFAVDVEATLDLRAAGERDDLAATADYGAMYEQVRAVLEGPSHNLLEAVAEEVARRLLAEFPPLQAVTVRVAKPAAPIAGAVTGTVAVEIHRARAPAR
ncbi:MAG TPA: dihydroneopterin aldolase [Chloroflexota bacterium]|nr:dihydroneopterin aldolase [Chloroflexota bacterium]